MRISFAALYPWLIAEQQSGRVVSPPDRERRRRRQATFARRRRVLALALTAVAALALIALLGIPGSGGAGGNAPPSFTTTLVARAAPNQLPAPISGEAVVAMGGGPLILGGLDSSSTSVSGVFQLDAGSGRLHEAGTLIAPLHDAAAVALGDRVLVFGGGDTSSADTVQSLPITRGGVRSGTLAREIGKLPTVRSDLSAVSLDGRAYVLGGYDGSETIDSVLETSDGSSFRQIATLPAPARYMAVAPYRGRIYAFGGESTNGTAGAAIQVIDPTARSARLLGHLPEPLSHAAAFVLGGQIYLAGGEAGGSPSAAIWRFDPGSGRVDRVGRLPLPVSGAAAATIGSTTYLIGGTGGGERTLSTVLTVALHHERVTPKPTATGQSAAANGARPPFTGRLMIADRGNNRLLVVNSNKRVLWKFPSAAHPAPPGGFYFPDDAFFIHGGRGIISNEEQNERIVQLSFPSGKLLWSYGHPGVPGSEPGYLHEPDDAYLLKDGTVTVADAQNCRVLLISPTKKILQTFGNPSACEHEPPRLLGSPNGDTPLRDGNFLISEVNGSYIDEITPQGKLVWETQLPIEYPSDPQQVGPNRYLVADYTDPGGIYEFDRAGKILWSYHPAKGTRMLNHPSLAERLPNGLIAANDDYRARVVIIDPSSRKIVWQYGHTGEAGTGPGQLRLPDGFDLLAPNGTTPTHPYTG